MFTLKWNVLLIQIYSPNGDHRWELICDNYDEDAKNRNYLLSFDCIAGTWVYVHIISFKCTSDSATDTINISIL